MGFTQHEVKWMGHFVRPYGGEVFNFSKVIYRVEQDLNRSGFDLLERYLAEPACSTAPGLVLGSLETGADLHEVESLLTANRTRLPHLKGLFLSDISSEECELPWITVGDVTFVFRIFPGLEHLRLRPGHFFEPARHLCLKSLVVESAGLSHRVIDSIASSVFPELEHLNVHFGTSPNHGDCTPVHLQPLLEKGRFPKLKSLGLRDTVMSDWIAAEIAESPLLDQLEVLDLSLGTLSDRGGAALLASAQIEHLKKLDLHDHQLSREMMVRLRNLNVEVDLSDANLTVPFGGD